MEGQQGNPGNGQRSNQVEFLSLLSHMMAENGIGWMIKVPVVVPGPDDQPIEILKTPSQLMADSVSAQSALVEAVESLTDAVYTSCQIALINNGQTWADVGVDDQDHEDEFPTEVEEESPKRRKRR